jgi:xanthine dehydrogenase accessory factor
LDALLPRLIATLDRGLPVVYCAVIETRGSTPQKAGAALLAFPDGTQAGTLGGGCVEAEVKRLALAALTAGTGAAVHTFQLNDDYGWDDGLICGGRMTVLVHPVSTREERAAATAYYGALQTLTDRGGGITEAVVIGEAAGLPLGDRYLFNAAGTPVGSLAAAPLWEAVVTHLPTLSARSKPTTVRGIAYLPGRPKVTLLLVGGGHVGQAVARLAAEVGFGVWVLDDRERFAGRELFPAADRLLVGSIGETLRELVPQLTPSVYALVMTRGHNHDEEALYHLAESRCGYVGMIGSRRKVRLIFDDLAAKGVSAEALARVHAPLGLDIGSQTVPEIAVSIVAELIACRNLGNTVVPTRTREAVG